ncbi:MAG: diguanylate cyclase [Gammaproteobacteria bacterium]|nr:diguanylate cyclase [Gammaproteobacteria bacterium]
MAASNVSILVVDDSQSASNELEQILLNADFFNVQFCNGPFDAMQFLENNPVQILLIAWHMEDMDGLELAAHVKEMDDELIRYTYIILYSSEAPDQKIKEAFKQTIDGFLLKQNLHSQLASMMYAAEGVTNKFDHLLNVVHELENECKSLRTGQLQDPLTGLGNRRQAKQSLSDTIRQIESRGGAVCLLLIEVENYQQVQDEHSVSVVRELMTVLAKRLLQLVRPLDVVTYFAEGQFAVILLQPSIDQCTPDCYRRIFDGLRLKSYMTSAGYLSISIGMSICASEALTGPPNIDEVIRVAEANLSKSVTTGEIHVTHLNV